MRRPEVLINCSFTKLRPRMPFGGDFETCHPVLSKMERLSGGLKLSDWNFRAKPDL
jgi:hypothetical protein